jgi:hypothetical protein
MLLIARYLRNILRKELKEKEYGSFPVSAGGIKNKLVISKYLYMYFVRYSVFLRFQKRMLSRYPDFYNNLARIRSSVFG